MVWCISVAWVLRDVSNDWVFWLFRWTGDYRCYSVLCGIQCFNVNIRGTTVQPVKSDSDIVFWLQSLGKTLTCALHLS